MTLVITFPAANSEPLSAVHLGVQKYLFQSVYSSAVIASLLLEVVTCMVFKYSHFWQALCTGAV